MTRRWILTALLAATPVWALAALRERVVNAQSNDGTAVDDGIVVRDGWILRKSDL